MNEPSSRAHSDIQIVALSDAAESFSSKAAGPQPDAAWAARNRDGDTVARCSLWWSATPRVNGLCSGMIGHYHGGDPVGSQLLLEHACRELYARGCNIAIGPVDGSTWNRYRFVTERGTEPGFFLEPDNPDEWPRQFECCGFQPFASYRSALQDGVSVDARRLSRIRAAIASTGIRVRHLDAERAGDELSRIHRMLTTSFRENLLFTPIGEEQFVRLHTPLVQCANPELVLLAEQGSQVAAMLFAVPDLAQARRGLPIDTVIVKTVAALPGRRYAGVAHVLAAHGATIARELGYRRVIHALMHDSIASANWSARTGETIRRYTLYARTLH